MTPWLPFGTGDAAPVRLLCLPHAGAGASAYRTWGQGLPEEIAACPVQLPGRESRMGETPYDRVEDIADDLAGALFADATGLRTPYALFGHSMGAIVAFALAQRLRERGLPEPVHLFVSGRQAPHLRTSLPDLRHLGITELAAELATLGGTPRQVLDNPDLLGMIAPLLRADFAVNETYRHTGEAALDIPVTAFAAAADPRASVHQVDGWREATAGAFHLHRLPGDHFAVLRQAAFVHRTVAAALHPWTAPVSPRP
ncbi:thioesterase II family protein [Actinokineospora guangxiensis]|uniref:Thioesterase II family protein n=1 Tax=Actinokineospora guangxiensis TaxID=1490288 RepID=A0ABW0EKY7_9PSEU